MKKKIIISLSFVVVIMVSLAVGAYAATDIKLFINGKLIKADLQIVDGSSYVPLRVVSESLGADVKWDGVKREIQISAKGFDSKQPNTQPQKSYNVKVNVTSGPMRMDVSKVTLDPLYKQYEFSEPIKAVILDVAVENTSIETVNWFPTDGKIVTNMKEQAEGYLYSDLVGGDFYGKVIKRGNIVFEIKGDLNAITSFNYFVDGSNNKDYQRIGEEKKTEFILK